MANAVEGSAAHKGWIWILIVLGVADIAATFESLMIVAALPAAIRDIGDPASAGWLITGYLLVAAISAAVGGRLADIFGRRLVLLVAIMLSVVGSILSYASTDLTLILIGRAIQGTAGAIPPITLGLVREHCPKEKVSLCVGILLSATGVAATAGLIVGALIVDNLGWHHIFAAGAIFGLIAFVTCLPLPKSVRKGRTESIDFLGAVLFVPMVVVFLVGIDRLSERNVWPAIGLLAAGAILLAVWWRHERGHPHPLIDVRLLSGREMAVLNICSMIWAAGALQFTQIQQLFLQQPLSTGVGLGLVATMAALVKIPAKAATMFITPLAGHLVEKIGSRYVIMIGFAISIGGWLAMLPMPQNLWVVMIIMTLGCAIGQSVIYAGLSTAVVIAAPGERTSEAAGVLAVTRVVGQALGVQITMAMLANWFVTDPHSGHSYPSETGYMTAFLYIIALCAVGIVAAAALPHKSRLKDDQPAKSNLQKVAG